MRAFRAAFFGCFGVGAAILVVIVVAAVVASVVGDDEDQPRVVSTPAGEAGTATVAAGGERGAAPTSPTGVDAAEPIGSSRDRPAPRGTSVKLRDWVVQVDGVIPDATRMVLEANRFNDPPAPGRQFLIVQLTIRYEGTKESVKPATDLSFSLFGGRGVEYTTYDEWCGVIPNELDRSKDVLPGGSLSGNLCWSVPSDEVDTLVLRVQEGLLRTTTAWFTVR